MSHDYELTVNDLNNIYDSVKKYGISKEYINYLVRKFIKVKKNQYFSPPADCLCLLLNGAFYSFEEKTDCTGKISKQIKCLISNSVYKFLYAPVEYCDENIAYKLSLSNDGEYHISQGIKIKASTDSIVAMLDIKKITDCNLSELISAYYINYSIQSKKIHDILQMECVADKKKYIFDNFPLIRNEYSENIISNFFGIKYDTWKHTKV